ncbi:P-loop containing nucleoside triphosphate hydrolase protein [Rhodocollybia butyracea]|uniref:P-loop containing nucleoside triphosphate hydrolase protein n=1 Tax=Rhodocollybia butyracea TaxID=206335 RepID=A0A9P5U0A3_9AGAR|nr:P-loop containing nucleoside triphosphate hydrolase protein [Rhodocollybia butyracea]
MKNPLRPSPAPPGFGAGTEIPEENASILSQILLSWLTPLIAIGFSRPLEQDDLWDLPRSRLTNQLADNLEALFYSECSDDKQPLHLRSANVHVEEERQEQKEHEEKTSETPVSLVKVLHRQFFWPCWTAGLLNLISQALTTTTPLVNKVLFTYLADSMSLGLSVRTALTGAITRKALRLSTRARLEHSSGHILTMISTDVARIESFCALGHHLWVAPIQLIIAVGLLIDNLGYSALVGLGVLIFSLPIQTTLVYILVQQRQKGVKFTDARIRLTTEVLQGIRLLKLFAWERFYAGKITELRRGELNAVKKSDCYRATYSSDDFHPSLGFCFVFCIIQLPLITLPSALASLADLFVAISRITTFLLAEEQPAAYAIDMGKDSDYEIAVSCHGDFVWDIAPSTIENDKPKDLAAVKKNKKGKTETKENEKNVDQVALPTTQPVPSHPPREEPEPFRLQNLDLKIPKGAFVAIVGRIGSGKSAIIQALIGEMRKTSGEVRFGGSVAYVSQNPWIQNATVRDNIMFGRPEDASRLSEVINACSLTHDLSILPSGEHTEIGEKGINISVGKDVLDNCLLSGPFANRTRVLVTHALHILDKTDYIYIVEDGRIKEEGTYQNLVESSEAFAELIKTHGQQTTAKSLTEIPRIELDIKKLVEDPLIQAEERNTGSVSWVTYGKYFNYAGGIVWVPVIMIALVLFQVCQVGSTLTLGFWTAGTISGFRQGDYIALYAGFGAGQAIVAFALTWAFAVIGIYASLNLFSAALQKVLGTSISFYDTTPIGRILSRLSKDLDNLDTNLPLGMMQFLVTVSSVAGTVGLVFYTFPLLGTIFPPMIVLYWIISKYYRRTSVEVKRLDSLARSRFYSSFSETLTGIATVRAYREEDRSRQTTERGLDSENQAYYITITLQWWLMIRLDLFASTVIFGIALFAAGFRNSVNPAKTGVVLTYALSAQIVSTFATTEQNMNAVERLSVYTELPPEEPKRKNGDIKANISEDWPAHGEIRFENVEMKYREGLPSILKDVSFHVKPGEKVGVVGRTGQVREILSSLLRFLICSFRIVEITQGNILIDGLDIRNIDLEILRTKIALVPQDTMLFLGTLRQNLQVLSWLLINPLGMRTDAELISLLQRTCLLPQDGSNDAKFSLDSEVRDDGLSAGERQLLALTRALVKNSRIIVLDEATSSVDVETDAQIQRTIQSEFASSTLITIAHRIHTILHYDRVLVMDSGKIAEWGTVLELYDQSGLSRADIVRLRATREW